MKKAWLISVSMGYGHQRTAYSLKDLAFEDIIQANDYLNIPEKDKKIWQASQSFYESISRFKKIPLMGDFVFFLFDQSQKIFKFYPRRDLSKASFQLKQSFLLIKKGWGKDLIEKLKKRNQELGVNLPIITTFFIPAFMAEEFNYPGEIYCVVCDADISRAWAPLKAKKSRIKYFAPNSRVVERLKLYGVKKENIFLTGYPLPFKNTGGEDLDILKHNLRHRFLNLDRGKKYFSSHQSLIKEYLGQLPSESDHPLTIMFCVGGAGAQKEIAYDLARSLEPELERGKIKLILSAGIRKEVKEYFERSIFTDYQIIYSEKIEDYFQQFNQALRQTDILWTKPSELSLFSSLGLPIIITPPIGSQERSNKRWLLKSDFASAQEDPKLTREWLFDWLAEGYLAEAALQAFIKGEKLGRFKIKEICFG